MNTHLSPKDLALAIGVSESSLKRWVDEGRLAASRTAGGHRRIAMHEAVRFIRVSGSEVVRPDVLGLPGLTNGRVQAVVGGAGEAALLSALQSGTAEAARGLILAQYLASRSIAQVCDGAITHAMHRIGELWRHSEEGIAIEHRALNICVEAMHQVRQLIAAPGKRAPAAVGGAPPQDPYTLPTLMAATSFMELGVRDVNLGADTPAKSLLDAARIEQAKFIWLSVSVVGDRLDLAEFIRTLAEGASKLGACVLVGGRGIYTSGTVGTAALAPFKNVHMIHSMSELAAFARSALAPAD